MSLRRFTRYRPIAICVSMSEKENSLSTGWAFSHNLKIGIALHMLPQQLCRRACVPQHFAGSEIDNHFLRFAVPIDHMRYEPGVDYGVIY
jgi:hypothetical protein